jgi:acetolactate synthase-1/2/3 large subunit
MPKLYTGAEIVFKCLEEQKVNHIFGYPGGAVLPIYDELKNHTSIKHILVRARTRSRSCSRRLCKIFW